jgi:lysophospholipase L1-like esterase
MKIYGDEPPNWDFKAQQPADLVVINIGTNDNNPANNVPSEDYFNDYVKLVADIHRIWPHAQIVLMVCSPHTVTFPD